MATSGPNQAGAVVETDVFETPWTDTSNAIVDDNVYALSSLPDFNYRTNYLDYSTFGTFSGVAAGTVITNVTVEIAGKGTNGGVVRPETYQLIIGGSPVGSAYDASAATFGTSETYVSSGAMTVAGNLGTTLNGAQANASNFGVRVQFIASNGPGDDLYIDACRITLTYSASTAYTLDAQPGSFSVVGVAAQFPVSRSSLNAQSGSFTITGIDATFTVVTTTVPSTGINGRFVLSKDFYFGI